MVRVLLLMIAASALSLAAVPADARPHKPAPAESSHKKPAAKGHAKGHDTVASSRPTHGKGRHADEETPKASKHGKGKSAHADEDTGDDEGCTPVKATHGKHGKGRKAPKACSSSESSRGHGAKASHESDEDCAPAPVRGKHGRKSAHARKPSRACSHAEEEGHGARGGKIEEEDCVEVAVKSHGKPARGRHAHAKTTLKCTTRLVSARHIDEPPPGPPPPPPLVVAAPGSPADIVKHSGPAPGVESTTNPELWAQRDQAQHRPHLPAAPHLTAAALMGHTDEDVRQKLGMPDLAHNEGDGALWTYRLPACSLMVFMKRTDGSLKVTGAQAAPLSRGGSAIGVDQCLAASAGR